MKRVLHKIGVIQNIGLGDRVVRITMGAAMMIGVLSYFMYSDAMIGWQVYIVLMAVYPLMTGFLGWDPLYAVTDVKTCSLQGRNQCGTMSYQLDVALGHDPHPDHEYDHSLAGSHH